MRPITNSTITITTHDAIAYLNGLLAIDIAGISALFEQRVPVAERFADDRCAAQVDRDTDSGEIMLGALGVLNGLFGTREDGGGHIVAHVDHLGAIQRFTVAGEPSDPPFKVVPLTPAELAAARIDVLGVAIEDSSPRPDGLHDVAITLHGMCPHNAVTDTNPPTCAKCGKDPTTEPSLDDPTTLSAADAYDYRVSAWLLEVKANESLASAVSTLRDRVRELEKALVSWRAGDAWSGERLGAIARQIR